MRSIYNIVVITTVICIIGSCAKETPISKKGDISAVTVINGIAGASAVVPDFSNEPVKWYSSSTTKKINYGSFLEYSISSGAVPLSVCQITDTTTAIFKTDKGHELDLKPHWIYSLFLSGQSTPTLQLDAVWVKDSMYYHPVSDSSMGVRFINLSLGSNPVNVTLSTTPSTNETANLAYKTITYFKSYPTIASVSNYTFQFRDAVTNAILGSFTMSGIDNATGTNTNANLYRFRNFTLALIGLPGGSGTTIQKVVLINNY